MDIKCKDTNEEIQICLFDFDYSSGNWFEDEIAKRLDIKYRDCGSREYNCDGIDFSKYENNDEWKCIIYGDASIGFGVAIKTIYNKIDFDKIKNNQIEYQKECEIKEKIQQKENKKQWHKNIIQKFCEMGLSENQGWKAYKIAGSWMFENNFKDFINYCVENFNIINKIKLNTLYASWQCDNLKFPNDSFPRRISKIKAALNIIYTF